MRVKDLHAGRHYYVSDRPNWLALGSGARLILLSETPYAYVSDRFDKGERVERFEGIDADVVVDTLIVPSSTGWRATSQIEHSAGALMIRADKVTGAPRLTDDEGDGQRAVAFIVDPRSIRGQWDDAVRQVSKYADAEHARDVEHGREMMRRRARWVEASKRIGDVTLGGSVYVPADSWTGRWPDDRVVLTLDNFDALTRRAQPDGTRTANGVTVAENDPGTGVLVAFGDNFEGGVTFSTSSHAAYALAALWGASEADYIIGTTLARLFPFDPPAIDAGMRALVELDSIPVENGYTLDDVKRVTEGRV